jgi:hypothetical protein
MPSHRRKACRWLRLLVSPRDKPVATNALEEEWAATAGALLQAPGE